MLRRLSLAVAVFVASAALVAADDFRVWKDTSGRFTIKAKLVSQAAGKVTLEKEDGSTVEIAVARLSPADRAHLATLKPMADPDDPFTPKGKPKAGAGPAAGEPKDVTPDMLKAKVIGLNAAPDKWDVPVGPAPAGADAAADPVALPGKRGFFEKANGLAVSPAAGKVAVGYALSEPGKKGEGSTRLVLCDLKQGKRVGGGTVPGLFVPVALADDGVRVLVRKDEFGFGNNDKLELWLVNESGLTRSLRWAPHDDLKGGDRDVKFAAFAGPDRVVTAGGSGRVTVWNIAGDGVEAVFTLQAQNGGTPALSPDRKVLAFTTDKELGLLDVTAGKVVALGPLASGGAFPTLAFSPSGKRLARQSGDKVTVWDVATGEAGREVGTLGPLGPAAPFWPTDDHVLVGNRFLVDIESQVKLWEYQGVEQVAAFGGLAWFVASDGEKPGALVPAKLPPPSAKDKLDAALALPDFFVLKPGTVVDLDTSDIEDGEERVKVDAALTAKLKGAGFGVGPNGTIELLATLEPPVAREVSVRSFGAGPFNVKTYKFKQFPVKIRFVSGGKTAWERVGVNGPGFLIRRKEGETMEQYLKKLEKPNYEFFRSVELPKLLTRPDKGATLGSSRVTTAGVR